MIPKIGSQVLILIMLKPWFTGPNLEDPIYLYSLVLKSEHGMG